MTDYPIDIFNGFIAIMLAPDILLTDYIYIGGVGATLINAASVGIAAVILMKIFKCDRTGTNIMAIWLMVGFAFFGKNVVNSLPIIAGAYLYSVYAKKPFSNFIAIALLSTSLSPVTTQMFFIGQPYVVVSLVLGIFVGVFVGFIMIPISIFVKRAHSGYNMYNVGFAAGILGMLSASIIRNFGFELTTMDFWSSGNNTVLFIFCMTSSLFLIVFGWGLNEHKHRSVISFIKEYRKSAKVIDDSYIRNGEQAYLNMGLLGICSTLFILGVGGELSGPLIGGIFTIIGFSCMGKNLFNIAPPIIGCCLVVIINGWNISEPGFLLTMLFSTTLAPISSAFGIFWGIAAGFLHFNLAITFADVHGGLNLYNNGVVGGFVAMLLVPVISLFTKQKVE